MKTVGLFEAKTKLSEICEKVVETGEVYTITKRGKPMVRIEPVVFKTGSAIWDRVEKHREKFGPSEADHELPERGTGIPRDFLD